MKSPTFEVIFYDTPGQYSVYVRKATTDPSGLTMTEMIEYHVRHYRWTAILTAKRLARKYDCEIVEVGEWG